MAPRSRPAVAQPQPAASEDPHDPAEPSYSQTSEPCAAARRAMLVASRVFPPLLLAEGIVGLQLEVLEVSLAPHVLQQVVVRIAASPRWFRRRWAAAAHKAHRTQHVRPHTYARISMRAVCIYRLSAPDNAAEIRFVNHLNAHLCVHLVQ